MCDRETDLAGHEDLVEECGVGGVVSSGSFHDGGKQIQEIVCEEMLLFELLAEELYGLGGVVVLADLVGARCLVGLELTYHSSFEGLKRGL